MLCLLVAMIASGCRLHVADDTLALQAATAPVIHQAAEAYRAANALHNLKVNYDAVAEFDTKKSAYNPRDIEVLLSDKDIAVRLAVLESFQVYVKSLCAIVSGTNPKELTEASVSVGGELSSLGNALVPAIEKAAGLARSNGASASTGVISPETKNAITTGIDALGQFLINHKVKAELPAKISAMDPHVQALATLLESDIDVLIDQERLDYDRIIDMHTLSIRAAGDLPFGERREEIMKLPNFVRKERNAQERLTTLRAAIVALAKAHQQLAADAAGKNPESFKQQLKDLANSAEELGTFYSSLPAE